jgi:hypothetical protein
MLTFACTLISSLATTDTPVPPTDTNTPEPAPTEPPPEAPPTEEPPPPAIPTEAANTPPVIDSVDLEEQSSAGGMQVSQVIRFHDDDGDASFIDYEIISASADDLWVEGGAIDIPPDEQKRGGTITGEWDCGSDNYVVTLHAILSDQAGNQSAPMEYTITCGRGVSLQGEFPDAFDDNRNGWGLDEQIAINKGMLQFRDIPGDRSRWTWCETCLVSRENHEVTVEASWSNSPNASLGLLIDNGTCNPDGLVFVLGPHGYYSIISAVRDDDGEWRHWRPYIDWIKSSLIRPGLNQSNIISAQYEFGDELRVALYINETYVTRVRVYGYNASGECLPGLYSDGGLEANFDNFDIP